MEKDVKNILIVGLVQYGYNTDWYNYAELLSQKYNVIYLCVDEKRKKRESRNVKVYYVRKTKRYRIELLKVANELKKKYSFKRVFIYVFPGCSTFRLLFNKNQLILDIRTSYITNPIKKWILDRIIRVDAYFYGRITVISWGVAKFLHLNEDKCVLLPLGGKDIGYNERKMNKMRMIYIGTFYDRHIEKTIDALSIFINNNPKADIHYTIIGVGSDEEIRIIQKRIIDRSMHDIVSYVGEVRGDDLLPYYRTHNIGISYVPLTDYYDCQPPTKTYEYLLGSMLVIATPTTENSRIVSKDNGYLCDSDSPEDIAKGIQYIHTHLSAYDCKIVYESARQYSWEMIVERYLFPLC